VNRKEARREGYRKGRMENIGNGKETGERRERMGAGRNMEEKERRNEH
jgi:hypothetical protein